jgi:ABC-type bacteriocin/lantibiotic exporter with double-glycine peptidase domain
VIFNAKLFLLLLVVLLPPVVIVFYFIKKRLTLVKKNIAASNERSYKYLLDALKGYVEANIYNRNDFFLQRFINSRQVFSSDLFDTISLQNMPSRIIEIFAVLGLFILIAIARWTGNDDSAALITIGAFMAAAYKILPGIVKIINLSGQIRTYEFAVNDLAQKAGVKQNETSKSVATPLHSLRLKNICFQYPDQPVLNNFSFSAAKSDFIGITGASGKGKTTVLNLLLGFLKPSEGEIHMNGLSVNKEELKEYWPLISYARQQPFFIHDTILRNITLEEKGNNDESLQFAITVSGLNDFISKFPEGMEKIITENGKNISGGQQQRIIIARALYKNADLILLDEPFNELDEASTNSLLEHFRQLALAGKIIIMITHDKKSLSWCNKVISLDEQ